MKLFNMLLLLFSISIFAQAEGKVYETFVGRITLLKGNAIRVNKKDKNEVVLKKGDKVYKNDTIRTRDRSVLKLKLVDESMITLSSNSEFEIDQYEFKTKADRSALFNVIKGQIRASVPIKAKKNALQYHSRTAALAVRGTKFLMNVHEDKHENDITEIAVIEGSVEVTDKKSNKDMDLNLGDHYVFLKDKFSARKDAKRKLSSEELEALNSIEESTEESPYQFLQLFEGQVAANDGAMGASSSKGSTSNKRTNKGENWKNTLNKLNKTLQENRDTDRREDAEEEY